MSERREKKKRHSQRLQHIAEFSKWHQRQPPKLRIISWLRWLREQPEFDTSKWDGEDE